MKNYYEERVRLLPSTQETPDYGVTPEQNPGEAHELGYADPASGRSAVVGARGARPVRTGDVGSQVGIRRNLEYSAGGRSHRISTGPYTRA